MGYLVYSVACVAAILCTKGCNGTVTEDIFDYFVDQDTGVNHTVLRYTIENSEKKISCQLINFGATVTSLRVPDKDGNVDDILLGFDNVQSYNDSLNPYFGATVGRVANRVRGGTFKLDGTPYNLFKNAGNDTLHGGRRGFSRVMWQAEIKGDNQVKMTYVSPRDSEGFPGEVTAEATFTLLVNEVTKIPQLVITYKATANQRTPINIVNHAYFNLAGHKAGKDGIYRHKVQINADQYTKLDATLVPTGEIVNVTGTAYDLRNLTVVKAAIDGTGSDGVDINFCINGGRDEQKIQRDTAYIVDETSGRYLKLSTDQPGVQFYTHNNDNKFTGKEGFVYERHGAFCLETQNYPDAVNHDNFPNSIYGPNELYSHTSIYELGISIPTS